MNIKGKDIVSIVGLAAILGLGIDIGSWCLGCIGAIGLFTMFGMWFFKEVWEE